jgi:hypothetical protein
MQSQWVHLKHSAIQMRKRGSSIRDIEAKLSIARSTLSGWLADVPIAKIYQARLHKRWKKALGHARGKAVAWHNKEKAGRLEQAHKEALESLSHIDSHNPHIVELALALLYLGEGVKKSSQTALGNSDPQVLQFFVVALRRIYNMPLANIKCDVHIRADQSPSKEMHYWSRMLGIPIENFGKTSIDKRTRGRPTYKHYHGVCVVRCGRVAIQRKLVYIATTFCNRVVESNLGG